MTDPAPPPGQAPLDSALPPAGARALAMVAIVVAGVCGGLIGYKVAQLALTGEGDLIPGLIGLAGWALIALSTVWPAFRLTWSKRRLAGHDLALYAVALTFVSHMVLASFLEHIWTRYIWLLVGLSAVLASPYPEEDRDPAGPEAPDETVGAAPDDPEAAVPEAVGAGAESG